MLCAWAAQARSSCCQGAAPPPLLLWHGTCLWSWGRLGFPATSSAWLPGAGEDSSGGARATVSGLQDDDFTLEASGGSRVVLNGFTKQFDMEASRGSQVQALGLTAESAMIDANGGSKATVAVTERIIAEASGGSTIVVHGNPPQRETRTSSGGQVLFE